MQMLVSSRIGTASDRGGWQVSPMRIGIIDDSEADRLITRRVILRAIPDATVREFSCPVEALVSIKRGELPRLLFLDLHMPRMSGFEVLDRIPTASRCRVALLTSSGWGSDRERAFRYPCVHAFIEKPLTKESLTDFVLGRSAATSAAE